jgi:hypothetical protein
MIPMGGEVSLPSASRMGCDNHAAATVIHVINREAATGQRCHAARVATMTAAPML